jgi:hypothetical protein
MHLWLTNEEALYYQAIEYAKADASGDSLKAWVEQDLWWQLVMTHDGRNMINDLGSTWRVDWRAVASALREE